MEKAWRGVADGGTLPPWTGSTATPLGRAPQGYPAIPRRAVPPARRPSSPAARSCVSCGPAAPDSTPTAMTL
jgi:hypothetical protein